jgi:16S rRNA processing protein RimM
VRGLRGLRGHVRVELLTDHPEERFVVGTVLFPEGATRGLTIAESSAVADGPGWWLRFAEIPSREAAESLRDTYLEIDRPDEAREPGMWFFHELEGLAVRSTTGEDLGRIVEIYRAGGAEVFVVRGPRGEIDVPGVRGIVAELAPERGEMVVDMDALDMDARPVDDEDYVRPRDRRPKKQAKGPKGPAQPPKGTRPGPKATPDGAPAARTKTSKAKAPAASQHAATASDATPSSDRATASDATPSSDPATASDATPSSDAPAADA